MAKSPDAFRTISEVADWLGVQAHVLRFWESKFTQVKPVKRAGGRRYYRPSDMRLLGGIKKLLHDDGLTIKGVQKILREQGVAHVGGLSQSLEDITGPVAAPGDAGSTVLRFRDRPAKDQDIEIDAVAGPDPGAAAPSAPTPAPPAGAPETAPGTAPETSPEIPDVATAAPSETAAPGPEPEAPVLPSFLHRPANPDPQPAPKTDQRPAPAPPRAPPPHARAIDAPDPPADADIPYVPGALGQLAGLDRLSPEQAGRIAPLATRLRNWMAAADGAGLP